MDGTSTVCGQWYGRSVKAVVTMACYGVPEGGSRSGAAPLPLEVALLTKADEACLTDVVNCKFLYVELPNGTSFLFVSSSFRSVLSALHFMRGYCKNPLPYLLVLSHLWICLPFFVVVLTLLHTCQLRQQCQLWMALFPTDCWTGKQG